MEDILIGVTDRTIPIFIPDPASTTGAGKTGLAAAAITVTYTRYETDNDVVTTDVTSSLSDLSALTDAHADWGWKEVSNTLSKGQYRLDIADAVFASGAWYAVVQVTITSGTAAATPKAFRLVSRNDLDGVRLGLTSLPNAAADAAGGLAISDAGGLDLDAKLANTNEVTAARMGALTDWINGGRLDLIIDDILLDTGTTLQAEVDGIQADTEDIQTRLPAALTANGNIKADTLRIGGTVQTAGDVGADAAAILVDTNELQTDWTNGGRLDLLIDAVLADTAELQTDWVDGGRLDLILDARASQASVNTIDDFLDTEIADILTDTSTTIDDLVDDLETRFSAALATQLTAHSLGVGRGVSDAGGTTTAVVIKTVNGAAGDATNDHYNGRHLVFTSGALILQACSVTDYVGATKTLTVTAMTEAAADNDTFIIV